MRAFAQLRRRADFLSATAAGTASIAFAYYLLLLQVTNVHTMVEKTAIQPVYPLVLVLLVSTTFLLFGLNVALLTILLRARVGRAGQAGSALGAVVGSFGAACPSCGAFLLSALGVSAGLSVLPFAGLEIWAAAAAIMAVTLSRSLRVLGREVCPTDADDTTCPGLPAPSASMAMAMAMAGLAVAGAVVLLAITNEPHLR